MAAVSVGILGPPVAMPAVLVTVAGYLAVAGGVMSAACQVTTMQDPGPDGTPRG